MKLFQYLQKNMDMNSIQLFFDIETFQYNEDEGKEFPSKYKNMTFSVCVGWVVNGEVELEVFPNFKMFIDVILSAFRLYKNVPKVILNAHNSNKYDNHFLLYDLLYYYPHMTVENYHLITGTTEKSNENSLRLKDLTEKDKQGIVLEKRVKSKINLEMIFFINNIQFETVDNWVKTNSSIAMLGNKMLRLGVIKEEELKTDFDYLKYNLSKDLSDQQARNYAQYIFDNLTPDELTYIKNDVILLAKSVYYYSDIFKAFDYSKFTFTSNILDSYNTNNLTSMQLLNRIKKPDKKTIDIKYTDYQFQNQNYYDYLKPFYRGGLNFYNQFKIGQIIDCGVFSMDINSSYPFAMHNFKIPTFLHEFIEFDTPNYVSIEYDNDDYYSLYRISKQEFDNMILDRIDSILLKQLLVKYYTTNEFININSYTFKMIRDITGITFYNIQAYSKVTYKCEYFGSRDILEEFYRIKQQGSSKTKLIFNSPYDIVDTGKENDLIYSREEIDNSKVNLNGLYGIPALRPYFNLFRRSDTGDFYNVENGHKNSERNIMFSIFVTSVSLWNLLTPLKYLTQDEIDEHFLYCDTDSLYFEQAVRNKLPDELFSDNHLGKWDIEHEHLKKFYVLNHKKYAYVDENNEIQIKSGGIVKDSFNTNMSFEQFIDTQFSHGKSVTMNKGIYNEQGTISIYPSKTYFEIGQGYRITSYNPFLDNLKNNMLEQIKESIDEFTNDLLFVESVLGTFSISDIFPYNHEVENKKSLNYLLIEQEYMKDYI